MNIEFLKTLRKYKKELEAKGYNILYIGLYGSQNYNLDDQDSDIDVKVIIAPKFDDFIKRKPISKVEELSSGQAQISDILTFYEIAKRGNPAALEAIHSQYWLGDKKIKEFFKTFKVNQRAIVGMAQQKYIALDHKYPSKVKEIEKWGFDPKQLHHIVRLYDLLSAIVNDEYSKPFITYPDESKEKLIRIKRNLDNLNLPQARQLSNEYFEKIKKLVASTYKFNRFTTPEQDKFISDVIKNALRQELFLSAKDMSCSQYRTFDNQIPKKDLQDFPVLKDFEGQDISYWIYKSIEIDAPEKTKDIENKQEKKVK